MIYVDLLQHQCDYIRECQKNITVLQETVEHLKTDKVFVYTVLELIIGQ